MGTMAAEFQESDYGVARSYADSIKTSADTIQGIFDYIDGVMKTLYSDAWRSTGAENANERYQEIRKNYEIFYNNVVKMHDHVYKVTESNEAADTQASAKISSI